MPKLRLNRAQLASFLTDPQAIRAFEQVFDFQDAAPATIEEASQLAAVSLAVANAALAELAQVRDLLEQLIIPAVQLGTLSSQNHDSIDVSGGSVANVRVAATTFSTADTALVDRLYAARALEADHAASAQHAVNADTALSAATLTAPHTFPDDATDLDTVLTLANALRAAAVAKGL